MLDIVVSNRVARVAPGRPMIGGLAAALLPAVEKAGVVWFGCTGRVRRIPAGSTSLVQIESHGLGTIAMVDAPEQHYARYYEGFSNSTLWPLLHSRPELSVNCPENYASYCAMNAYMARMLVTFGGESSRIWVHDYHFLPLGRELRRLGVAREIGFFLHTPWPTAEIIASLPQYRELVDAMLSYDLIGFQTEVDRNNFADLLRKTFHIHDSGLRFSGRHGACRLAAFPIGIDAQQFADRAAQAAGDPDVRRLRASIEASRLVIGVDRIDYSKGLLERIAAFEHLLDRFHRLKRRLSMLQIAIPSRSNIEPYRHLQRGLARAVGEVNAKYGEADWTPIRYLNKGFCQSTLAGFYRSAAVGLVTPLRDGMNLVCKEYVAAQDPADPGVLVLSKFAGASQQLSAALQVDPQDTEQVARQIASALMMPLEERRARWQQMMDGLLQHSIHSWFFDFMRALVAAEREHPSLPAQTLGVLPSAEQEFAAAHR